MSAPPGQRITPGGQTEGDPRDIVAGDLKSTSSMPPGTHKAPRRHDYALLVVAARRDGVLVSQVYTNLPAAELKVSRAHDRGLFASITLVRLEPVVDSPVDLTLVGVL